MDRAATLVQLLTDSGLGHAVSETADGPVMDASKPPSNYMANYNKFVGACILRGLDLYILTGMFEDDKQALALALCYRPLRAFVKENFAQVDGKTARYSVARAPALRNLSGLTFW